MSVRPSDPTRFGSHDQLRRLKEAAELFAEVQPEVSTHTNFQMARQSLEVAVRQIVDLLETDE